MLVGLLLTNTLRRFTHEFELECFMRERLSTAARGEPIKARAVGALLISRHPAQFRGVIFIACTSATNFCNKGDVLSFFQIRLNGSRTFISTTGSKTMPRGQCQRIDSVIQAIPIRHWTRFNKVSRSVAS